jgi:hypothetical protein
VDYSLVSFFDDQSNFKLSKIVQIETHWIKQPEVYCLEIIPAAKEQEGK